MSAGWPAQLTVSAFNRLRQCASSAGNSAYCYAELTVSSLAMAVTSASTHCAYPQRDGQAELPWVVNKIPGRCERDFLLYKVAQNVINTVTGRNFIAKSSGIK